MRQIAYLAGMLTFSACAFAADSQLMNLVMPNAQVMAGINVTTAQISPFGQYVLAQMATNDTGLQSLIALTGFDPRKDVTEILVASSGDPSIPGGLVLAKGTFDVSQLTAAVLKDGKSQVSSYEGATLVTPAGPKSTQALAF